MKKFIFLDLIVSVLICSCVETENHYPDLPQPVYSPPLYTSLNTTPGYALNPVTGDSIKPLFNGQGDTLITGVPIKLQGKVLTPSQVGKKVVTAKPPKVVEVSRNRFPLPDQVTAIKVNTQALAVYPLGAPYPGVPVLDNTGNSQSGRPIPAKLIAVPTKNPQPVPANLPGFKDTFKYNIRYFDEEQGMNSSRVRTVLEDSRGAMWFGTHGGGVAKYNGESFTFYTREHGLNDDIITIIYEDRQNNLWFGTWDEGINMFDGETFFQFSANEYLNGHIASLIEDSKGNIWISSMGEGVFRFDGNGLTQYTTSGGLPSNNITSILEDKNGLIWFGSNGGGVIAFDGEYFTHYTENQGLSSNRVLSMIADKQGNLWIGSGDKGLCKFDGEYMVHYTTAEGLSDDVVTSVMEDQEGNIWIGTQGAGLNLFNGESFLHVTVKEGLSDNGIMSVLQDQQGYLWIGTQDGGVSIYDPSSFAHFTELEQLNSHHVRSIKQDSQGNYWFTTWGDGIILYDGKQFSQYTADHGLFGNTIWDMLIDQHGNPWFGGGEGGPSGICMFDGYRFTNMLPEYGVLSILEDSQGNLWCGTNGNGILKFNGETVVQYSTAEGFNGDRVWSMTKDQDGNLWFATWGGGGVAKYDGEYFTFYSEKEGLLHNHVWSVLEDRRGNLWFGTYGEGVSIFNGKGFSHITTEQGLSNSIVSSIIEDKDGNIWLGTEKGLNQIIINPDIPIVFESTRYLTQKPFEILSYTRNDGLKAADFNVHTTCLDRSNRIWWGTGKSLFSLNMNEYEVDRESPQVTLDQIDIGGNFMDYRNLSDSVKGSLTYIGAQPFSNLPASLEVPFKHNHLTFYFTASNTAVPHKAFYSYRMPGVSDEWSQPTTEAKADFRNIPYGEHTFLVCATGDFMNWGAPASYAFSVLPPWWHTWWARVAYLLAAIAGVAGIVRWRTANVKQRQKELEQMVVERTAEVVAQQKRSDELLLNILPANVAEELKETGQIQPVHFEEVSILFADFIEFTNIVASIPSKKLINELNDIFQNFDDIMEQRGLEKIQTIGDAYVAAGGLPKEDPEHAVKCARAARDIIEYLSRRNEVNSIKWKVRIGIHSGPITAGVVGKRKFAYDVFGDTVNIAARIQSASGEGRINVSAYTHDLIKQQFPCEYRGKIRAKGKGDLDMYFVMDHIRG